MCYLDIKQLPWRVLVVLQLGQREVEIAMANDDYDIDAGADEWVPEDAIEALSMERAASPSESLENLTARLFRENAPAAAMSIVHTALHGANERTRLDASKYVVERLLGKVGESNPVGAVNPLEAFLNGIEDMANKK